MSNIKILLFSAFCALPTNAFLGRTSNPLRSLVTRNMITITEGVQFDTIAREWRLKWSADHDKSSLAAVQNALDSIVEEIKAVDGVKGTQRIVCGGCLDYKVVISLPADKFGAWEQKKFAPEEKFLTAVSAIPGVSLVETQTYTLMPVF